jgi:hypothetical protein
MAFAISNAYQPPVSVELSDGERAAIHKQERIKLAVGHAKAMAKLYAKVVLNRCEAEYGLKAVDVMGGMNGLKATMLKYGVHPTLGEYAARLCEKIVIDGEMNKR